MSEEQVCDWEPALTRGRAQVEQMITSIGLEHGEFNIEEYWSVVDRLEAELGVDFIRMDFGVPGLMPQELCRAQHASVLLEGTASRGYPPYGGTEALKVAAARFFSDQLQVHCVSDQVFVTCGATQGLFVAQALVSRLLPERRSIVFLSPTYPPMMAQAQFLGVNVISIEIDGRYGDSLLAAIESVFQRGDVAAICWASPNNPTWRVLDNQELQGVAELCRRHGVVPIEDLTYLGMVARDEEFPNQGLPSIAAHSSEYFQVLSASKMLSYAGERIGFLVVSPDMLDRQAESIQQAFGTTSVRRACGSLIFNLTAGAPHSAQYGITSVLEAVNNGSIDLEGTLAIYRVRAHAIRKLLLQFGFYLIYTEDEKGSREGDGFYLCFGHPKLTGVDLVRELLFVGITVLPLSVFGSKRVDGVRACVGRVTEQKLRLLQRRLGQFQWR